MNTFIQDDEPLPTEERFITEYHQETVTLTIKDVTIDDEAYYKVEARNEHGVATTVVELFVQSKLRYIFLYCLLFIFG